MNSDNFIYKTKLYALAGSLLFCLLTILLLLFIYMPAAPKDDFEEEIMVSFGDSEDGLGFGDMQVLLDAESNSSADPEIAQTEEEPLITQNIEQTVTLSSNKLKSEKKPKQTQTQVRTNPSTTQTVAKKDPNLELERQRREKASQTDNLVGNAFGGGTSVGGTGSGAGSSEGKGSGSTVGDTRTGNPAGKGTSGGHGWSLSGRSLVGELVSPVYTNNDEGVVTVNIRVDANGNITTATIGSPTTISDLQTRNAALAAARKTRFSSGTNVAVGTITYNFRLR